MPTIGSACHELRVVDESNTWRIVYAVDSDAIVILEVFTKKTKATSQQVIRNCRRRLKAYREVRT